MKKILIVLACCAVATASADVAWAGKKHRRAHTISNNVEPQGAERQRQFELATKICQKKYGGGYTGVHAQWMRAQGEHGWFCTNQ